MVIDILGVYVARGGICEPKSTLELGYGSGDGAVTAAMASDFGCPEWSCWVPDWIFLEVR